MRTFFFPLGLAVLAIAAFSTLRGVTAEPLAFSSLTLPPPSSRPHPTVQTRFEQAVRLIRQNQLEQAKVELIALNRDYPELPEPFSNLAVVYAKQDRPFLASDILFQALKIHPKHPVLTENLTTLDQFLAKLPPGDKHVAHHLENIQWTVSQWREAWAAQNVDTYLAFYAPEFKPAHGLKREEWVTQRTVRLKTPSSIDLRFDHLSVKLMSSRTAEVTFLQTYQTSSTILVAQKRLILTRDQDTWRIRSEQASS